jgi:hypothetical protein
MVMLLLTHLTGETWLATALVAMFAWLTNDNNYRVPDSLSLVDDSHLTPIPTDEDVSSLSAILLSDDYYRFLHAGKKELDGLSFVGPEHLV